MDKLIRVIQIKMNDTVYEDEKVKYHVEEGDILGVIEIKKYTFGNRDFWKVRNLKTDEIGFVEVVKMEVRHNIYKKIKYWGNE